MTDPVVDRMRTDEASVAEERDTSRMGETILTPYPDAEFARDDESDHENENCPVGAPLPHRFGRFELTQELGEGGMGHVYLATDTRLGRQVAIKFPKCTKVRPEDMLKRFFREARAAAILSHPNVCPVYDADCVDGVPFIAMAYIAGSPLSALIRGANLPDARTSAYLVRKIALAVHEAHRQGIVHRDLKPANIVVDERGEPIVMDFGLARCSQILQGEEAIRNPQPCTDVTQTQIGEIVGTPRYMSPEQARGVVNDLGATSDIFSLGVIFYELLTGTPPFEGDSLPELVTAVAEANPISPTQKRPGIDGDLESICLKMIAKQPADRFASMQDVADSLEAFLAQAA